MATLKIEQDHNRFRQIVRGKVKQDLRKYISHEELIGRKGKDLISIPIPQIDIPTFRFSPQSQGGVGQGEGDAGTPIASGDDPGAGPFWADALTSHELPLERLEELMCLNQAIGELSEQERNLLYHRYFCEESQAELGRRFGVSQMQISRRLSKVLVRLQQRLGGAGVQSNPRPRTASRTS